ncbi:Angiotensin-converting enzyme-related protein, partial [Papilio machaon]
FQFHRSLCQLASEYTPGDASNLLSNCDIYKSTTAGNALGKMLQLGSSKPWPDAMEMLTGQRKMDASGVLEYFQPLHDWLKTENERTGEYIGWEPSTVRKYNISYFIQKIFILKTQTNIIILLIYENLIIHILH